MRLPYALCRKLLFALIAAALLIGCASTPTVPAPKDIPAPHPPISTDSAWWHARFQMDWPEEAAPSWHLDLLIAHRIVKPSLERHEHDIVLWRFHRRAARDEAGHQFSFIFFAPPAVALEIYEELSSHPLVQDGRALGRILQLKCDDTNAAARTAVSDTSDPKWSAPLRQAWPHYLMGASRMWLDLISGFVPIDQGAEAVSAFGELEKQYVEAGDSITSLWQHEGRHAFLHHLNALFGYEPLLIIERRHMRF